MHTKLPMMNDWDLLKKRFIELARKAASRGTAFCTGFLSMAEQADFFMMAPQIKDVSYKLFGGAPACERQILMFAAEPAEAEFPIDCLLVEPLNPRFSEELTHRDFLGALVNLGIARATLGDIFVYSNKAHVFCLNSISGFITENLTRVKHTSVRCTVCENCDAKFLPKLREHNITSASERLDAVLSAVYKLSREQSAQLVAKGCTYINGRLIQDASRSLKPNDIVTARGFGRFIYDGVTGSTKKGRSRIVVRIYE